VIIVSSIGHPCGVRAKKREPNSGSLLKTQIQIFRDNLPLSGLPHQQENGRIPYSKHIELIIRRFGSLSIELMGVFA
jgi:hypothetical protein